MRRSLRSPLSIRAAVTADTWWRWRTRAITVRAILRRGVWPFHDGRRSTCAWWSRCIASHAPSKNPSVLSSTHRPPRRARNTHTQALAHADARARMPENTRRPRIESRTTQTGVLCAGTSALAPSTPQVSPSPSQLAPSRPPAMHTGAQQPAKRTRRWSTRSRRASVPTRPSPSSGSSL